MDETVPEPRADLPESGQPPYEPPLGVDLGSVGALTQLPTKSGANSDSFFGAPEPGSVLGP